MNIPSFTWIEIKEGNPLPEPLEEVLFKFNDNERSWEKDCWENIHLSYIKATHWMKILQPEEIKSQSTEQ